MAKVFIGVGHGGSEPGAIANGLIEKDLNLNTALSVYDVLVDHGVTCKLSRTRDEADTLTEEIYECNKFKPDLAIDIHHNAGGGDGVEVFYSIVGGTGKVLAENILKEIVLIGQNSRGIKTKRNTAGSDWYGFIRQTEAPAVIVECAFLDSKDYEIVDTKQENESMGLAIAKGVLKTLGITYKPTESEKEASKTEKALALLKEAIKVLEG